MYDLLIDKTFAEKIRENANCNMIIIKYEICRGN